MTIHTFLWYDDFKVTRHLSCLCFKNSKNLRLLDILAYSSANKPSFRNPTKSLFAQCFHTEMSTSLLAGDREVMIMYSILAESQARMSRGCRFLQFFKHKCLVTLGHLV